MEGCDEVKMNDLMRMYLTQENQNTLYPVLAKDGTVIGWAQSQPTRKDQHGIPMSQKR